MICPHCGAPNQMGRFCMSCRKRLGEAAPAGRAAAPVARVGTPSVGPRPVLVQRVVTLTVIQAVFGAGYIMLAPSLFTVAICGPLVVLLLATAYGLHKLTPWGRILGVCMAAVSLLAIPLGTILAVFLLIYYFKPEVKAAFGPKTSPAERQLAVGAATLWKPLATLLGVANILLILVLLATAVAVVIPRMSGA